jgi:energy-coupling factor transporter transmembrane protein EcfT
MRDKSLGILMFTVSVLAMIGYFFCLFSWIFWPAIEPLGKPLSEWALIVPVMIIVYSFLFIVAWIGWAMASTPPPLSALQKAPEEKEETEEEE